MRITHLAVALAIVLCVCAYSPVINEPHPQPPTGRKFIIHLTSHLSPLAHGRLYFNDSLLLSYPLTTYPVKTFAFDKGGILAFNWRDSKICEGIQLKKAGEYDIHFDIDLHGYVHFWITSISRYGY